MSAQETDPARAKMANSIKYNDAGTGINPLHRPNPRSARCGLRLSAPNPRRNGSDRRENPLLQICETTLMAAEFQTPRCARAPTACCHRTLTSGTSEPQVQAVRPVVLHPCTASRPSNGSWRTRGSTVLPCYSPLFELRSAHRSQPAATKRWRPKLWQQAMSLAQPPRFPATSKTHRYGPALNKDPGRRTGHRVRKETVAWTSRSLYPAVELPSRHGCLREISTPFSATVEQARNSAA
jgi:hypothetical protein